MLTGSTSRGCVNRTDVLTIHLTVVNLHHLFKYRIDLTPAFGSLGPERGGARCVGRTFPEASRQSEQMSCLHRAVAGQTGR